MAVMTVTGPVEKSDLGVVLPHEHMFIDLTNQFAEPADPEQRRMAYEKLALSNLGVLRRNPYAVRENLILNDFDTAVIEAEFFLRAGGRTIVDCTSIGIGRSPKLLRLLAERTGLNVVAGCGYYTHDTHPAEMSQWSPEKIAEDIVHDLCVGIDGTDSRAGVIGEIGTSDPIQPSEEKNLIAAALASNKTKAPIQVHTYPWGMNGLEVIDILVRHGVDPARVVICHVDAEPNAGYIMRLLKTGVYVEFDNFGKEFYISSSDRRFAGGRFCTDLERVRCISQLVDCGYEDRILITNDICLKQMLHSYGGWGYDHILANIVPMMLDERLPESTVYRLIQGNPSSWLSQQ